jgi:agmatine/peptidylarginine deiminase
MLHVKRVLWLDHGNLIGDDTDGHVDTIARFAPNDTIVHVQCNDPEDEQFADLQAMEAQLATFRTEEGNPYRLLALPSPQPIYDEDGLRLPATYANFLVINNAVLYPTYAQPDNDKQAAEVLKSAFPGLEVVGIDCRALIKQHGSLHCVTMQYPKGR